MQETAEQQAPVEPTDPQAIVEMTPEERSVMTEFIARVRIQQDALAAGPLPGDRVVLIDQKTRDRDYGYITGQPYQEGVWIVVFNPMEGAAFWGRPSAYSKEEPHVVVSGGPCPSVEAAHLTLIGTAIGTYWRWIDLPRADGGERYTKEVALWEWDGVRAQI